MKIKKSRLRRVRFITLFFLSLVALYVLRMLFPDVMTSAFWLRNGAAENTEHPVISQWRLNDSVLREPRTALSLTNARGEPVRNKIKSVPDYGEAFPDLNDVQLETATRIGVPPVSSREEAERDRSGLIYIGSSPFFHVRKLSSSVPYLVPHAYLVLNEIALAFIDSLQAKGMPLHLIEVTSVLRTEEDIAKLRRRNGNASEQSCHRFGTTFDIAYNKYHPVPQPDGTVRRSRSDSLKWVLTEVLRDQRERGMCYVKYEVKQPCFHITAR